MTTTFVILAAGLGTRMGRVGEGLHKALVPLAGRAAISHLFELAPPNARLVVCVGYRADQVKRYVRLAHPQRNVTFVDVLDYDKPGNGPGASLLQARDVLGEDDDLAFSTVDTLWQPDATLWTQPRSWVATSPVPAGTNPLRWCRFSTYESGRVDEVLDKRAGDGDDAWVGLAFIKNEDLPVFWSGIERAELRAGERQISGGFSELIYGRDGLNTRRVHWTDIGDEESYRQAVAKFSGYDWTKLGQATYVLPSEGRVVKWMRDAGAIVRRAERGALLDGVVAQPVVYDHDMLAYPYLPGVSAYVDAERNHVATAMTVLDFFWQSIWSTRNNNLARSMALDALEFYREKTLTRIELLEPNLRHTARDAVYRVDWESLAGGVVPGLFHGDLNYANIVISPEGDVSGIDWREDFNRRSYGDLRYDLAKLLAGCRVNWDWAQRGDFRPWVQGRFHEEFIREFITSNCDGVNLRDVELIAALSLLNSAPLHSPPFDEVLVARGIDWLGELL